MILKACVTNSHILVKVGRANKERFLKEKENEWDRENGRVAYVTAA